MPGGTRWSRAVCFAAACGTSIAVGACSQENSALNPKGRGAGTAADLWWVMLVASAAIYALVLGLLVVGLARRRRRSLEPAGEGAHDARWIVLGGIVMPAVVLLSLLGLTVRTIASEERDGTLDVTVVGHQYWWEIRYADGDAVTANELHIPVGERVKLTLLAEDVIHSFWVPQLDGKADLVPGKETHMVLEASEPGVYRGQCAEFCGLQHANMAILVIASPPDEFDMWLANERRTAREPRTDLEERGREVFTSAPCAGCHTIRGVASESTFGPDLTHLAGRRTIGAGTRANVRGHLGGWVANAQGIKPGNLMPPVDLEPEELQALLAYLESLE